MWVGDRRLGCGWETWGSRMWIGVMGAGMWVGDIGGWDVGRRQGMQGCG